MLKFYEAVAILIGITIGAGILGIPYIIAKSGFFIGILDIIIIGLAILILNLYVGEIALRTNGRHQLTCYAERYLGKYGKWFITFSMAFGIYGALAAYILGVGSAIQAIFGGSQIIYSLLFFIAVSYLIYAGLNLVKRYELLFGICMLAIILIISFVTLFNININNFTGFDLSNVLIPYGVIFFAFIGTAAVPEMRAVLVKNKYLLKRAIIVGSFIPFIIYLIFTISVVGVVGKNATEIATISLGQVLGKYMVLFGNLFAILSMITSFLALGLAFKWVCQYDYCTGKNKAFLLTCLIPLIIALSGFAGFIKIIGFSGAIAGGIEGILIIVMHTKAKKLGDRKPEYEIKGGWVLNFALIALFVVGIVHTLIY